MFQSEGWSLLRPTHHSTRCLSSFELIVSAVRGLGWQGGWELWQFLLDSKARGVVDQARMFCPRCQVVKELWGRAMCPNSVYSLPDASNNNTVSNSPLLKHLWSPSPIFITIMKWLSWWQLSHTMNWDNQVPNRRNTPLMPYSKFRFLLEVGFITCIHILFVNITSKCYMEFSRFASLRLWSIGRVLMRSWCVWEILSEILPWPRSCACLSSVGEPMVFL